MNPAEGRKHGHRRPAGRVLPGLTGAQLTRIKKGLQKKPAEGPEREQFQAAGSRVGKGQTRHGGGGGTAWQHHGAQGLSRWAEPPAPPPPAMAVAHCAHYCPCDHQSLIKEASLLSREDFCPSGQN